MNLRALPGAVRGKFSQIAAKFLADALNSAPDQVTTQPLPETNQVIEATVEELPDFGYHATRTDQIKAFFVDSVALTVPFIIATLLGVSNGYFFSGFRDFSVNDIPVAVAWVTGFVIEYVALATIFNAATAFKNGEKAKFRAALAGGILLSLISLVAQYGYLQQELSSGAVHMNDSALNNMPFFSLLVGIGGAQGHDILFGLRSISYHIAEFICSFLIVKTTVTAEKAIEIKRKEFDYRITVQQNQTTIDLMSTVNNLTQTVLQQQQKQLELAMSQIQAQISAPKVVNFTEALPMKSQADQSQY